MFVLTRNNGIMIPSFLVNTNMNTLQRPSELFMNKTSLLPSSDDDKSFFTNYSGALCMYMNVFPGGKNLLVCPKNIKMTNSNKFRQYYRNLTESISFYL